MSKRHADEKWSEVKWGGKFNGEGGKFEMDLTAKVPGMCNRRAGNMIQKLE